MAAGVGTAEGCASELKTHPSHEPFETVRSPKPTMALVQFDDADSRVQ